MPPLLPTPQKKEYIELKKKLTMYEKRKQLKKKKSQLVSGNKPLLSTNLKKTSVRSPINQKPKVPLPNEKKTIKRGIKSQVSQIAFKESDFSGTFEQLMDMLGQVILSFVEG